MKALAMSVPLSSPQMCSCASGGNMPAIQAWQAVMLAIQPDDAQPRASSTDISVCVP